MDESEQNERLVAIVRRFYDYQPKTLLSFGAPPFDISRPNIHDSKPEFLAEKQAVDDAIRAAEALFEFLAGAWGEDKDTSALAIRVITAVDGEARFSSNTLPVETALGLIRRNAATHGLSYTMTALLADLARGLAKRKQALVDQEAEFWSGGSRPPNYYARTIALRFARLIAKETRQRPTFGTSRDGGHPSTEFGRALEEVFEILGIKANVRNAARWALSQLTEEDIAPPVGGLLSLGSLLSSSAQSEKATAKAAIVKALKKGQHE